MVRKIRDIWEQERFAQQKFPTTMSARLIGAPDDRGVMNVGGRLGAGTAPAAIRKMLGGFMLGLEGELGRVHLEHGHDVDLGHSIEQGHANLRDAVSKSLNENSIPIVLGGGHDYGFPHVGGVHDFGSAPCALINVDAHLDVRPPNELGITSGSPFFLAIEAGVCKPSAFVEFGIQTQCNDFAYHKWTQERGIRVVTLDSCRAGRGVISNFEKELARLSRMRRGLVVSFDLDAVQMAFAPAVSAPQSDGFTATEFLAMAELAGMYPAVQSVGFFELAPDFDRDQQTTRLAATAIYRFMIGLSRRGTQKRRAHAALNRLLPS